MGTGGSSVALKLYCSGFACQGVSGRRDKKMQVEPGASATPNAPATGGTPERHLTDTGTVLRPKRHVSTVAMSHLALTHVPQGLGIPSEVTWCQPLESGGQTLRGWSGVGSAPDSGVHWLCLLTQGDQDDRSYKQCRTSSPSSAGSVSLGRYTPTSRSPQHYSRPGTCPPSSFDI